MESAGSPLKPVRHYFVDESGDPTIFNARGRVIIGEDGCSTYFMTGLLYVPDPQPLSLEIDQLRTDLLADPYFKSVPSMQLERRKTAHAFHAKDDLPEVRREVFALLRRHSDMQFFAAVQDKRKELDYIREQQKADSNYRYSLNDCYDFLIWRMFKGKLHKADEFDICFAARGNRLRTNALRASLETARSKSLVGGSVINDARIHVSVRQSRHHGALQAVDYFLWALYRFFEKREDRYWDYLSSQCHEVLHVGDRRKTGAGVHYTQKKPLTLAAIEAL